MFVRLVRAVLSDILRVRVRNWTASPWYKLFWPGVNEGFTRLYFLTFYMFSQFHANVTTLLNSFYWYARSYFTKLKNAVECNL